MKTRLLTAAVCAVFCCGEFPHRADESPPRAPMEMLMEMYPQAARISAQIHLIGDVAKLSWESHPNQAYVIEESETLTDKNWTTHSIELAAPGNTTRRTIILNKPRGFYRVSRLATVPVWSGDPRADDERVWWGVDIPELGDQEQCSVELIFDDGTRASLWENDTGVEIHDVPYATPGLRTMIATAHCLNSRGETVFIGSKKWGAYVSRYSTNLVKNSDLEAGADNAPADWLTGYYGNNSATFRYPALGVNGSRAGEITVSNYTSGDAKWYFADIPAEKGRWYLWSAMYRSTVPAIATAWFKLTNGANRYVDIGIFPSSANWKFASAEFQVPNNIASVTVFHIINTNGMLAIDNVSLGKSVVPPLTEGMVSLDFDDGWKAAYLTASNVLGNAGFRGTFHIVTSRVGRDTIVTTNDLFDMVRNRHEVSSHTMNHLDLIVVSTNRAEWEVNTSKTALEAFGIQNITMLAYPFGAYDDEVRQITREAGYRGARSVDGGFNTSDTDPYALKARSLRSYHEFAEIKGWIDTAVAEKTWFILVFHHIDNNNTAQSVRPELFSAIVDYLKQNRIKVVTASEGLKLLGKF